MTCPSGKVTYPTHEEALTAVDRHKADQGFSMMGWQAQWSEYRCDRCGWWHLTSGRPPMPEGFGRRLRPDPSRTTADPPVKEQE